MESPRFPDNISVGVSFGPEFVTTIASNAAGYEYRNRLRSKALSRGDCGHSVKTTAQFKTLVSFFRSVGGRYSGFRFKDWSDYQLAEADSHFELVSGTLNQYQINKLYRAAVGYEEYRQIRKPVSGTVVVKDTGVALVVGGSAGNYSIDNTTGIITLQAKAAKTINSHTVGATHSIVISSVYTPAPTVGQFLVLSGITGTAASLLNNKLLPINTISGTTITFAVNTTGLTTSGGGAYLYSQQANLKASCEFDVPARFDTDYMPAVLSHPDVFDWTQIPITEVRV